MKFVNSDFRLFFLKLEEEILGALPDWKQEKESRKTNGNKWNARVKITFNKGIWK